MDGNPDIPSGFWKELCNVLGSTWADGEGGRAEISKCMALDVKHPILANCLCHSEPTPNSQPAPLDHEFIGARNESPPFKTKNKIIAAVSVKFSSCAVQPSAQILMLQ